MIAAAQSSAMAIDSGGTGGVPSRHWPARSASRRWLGSAPASRRSRTPVMSPVLSGADSAMVRAMSGAYGSSRRRHSWSSANAARYSTWSLSGRAPRSSSSRVMAGLDAPATEQNRGDKRRSSWPSGRPGDPTLMPGSAPASSSSRATSARPSARPGSRRCHRELHTTCRAVHPVRASVRLASAGSRPSMARTRSASPRMTAVRKS